MVFITTVDGNLLEGETPIVLLLQSVPENCQLKLSYRKSMLRGTSVQWPNLSNVCSVTLN